MALQLVRPSLDYLPAYLAALERGFSPDNVRGEAAAMEEIAKISENAAAFLDSLEGLDPQGKTVTLPDGTTAPRLPGYRRWIWDGDFAGSIGARWQPGTSALPPHCLGHIGYAVVPWKRGRGYARQAVKLILPELRRHGLDTIEVTADVDNIASQRVILACGGVLIERFHKPASHGGGETFRYRIDLTDIPCT
jgi:predicted acetyltransferase